jgi:hypothetical protein
MKAKKDAKVNAKVKTNRTNGKQNKRYKQYKL